jgi:hypothetical protein
MKSNNTIARNFMVWAEMARRKKQFHAAESWESIRLWGLMSWEDAKPFLLSGELLTDMRRENETIWVRPSPEAYQTKIAPLLGLPVADLQRLAGWVG